MVLPVPFGSRVMSPFVSVLLMVLPSSFRLSTARASIASVPSEKFFRCVICSRSALLTAEGNIPSATDMSPITSFDAFVAEYSVSLSFAI